MSGNAERPGPADGTREAGDLHPRKFDLLNLTLVVARDRRLAQFARGRRPAAMDRLALP